VAGSWRFTNEKFMEGTKDWLSNGKLRLGWGQTGNANIGGYKWGVPMSIMNTDFGKSYRPAQIANTGIKWESQEQVNVGLDLGFLQDRVNLTFDWYRKESKDMLMQLQLPSYMGTSGNASSALAAPWGNYGTIRNTGYEITLSTHPLVGRFQWDSEVQVSVNRNKLVALSGTSAAQIIGYGQWDDVVSVTNVGESLYNFYGYVCDGIYQDLEDLETSPKPTNYPSDGVFNKNNTVWVGDIKYKDLNGDGVIDENDRTNIGSPMPKFTFGWTNTFRYKNFDLSVFINGSVGNKVYNYLKMKLTHMNSTWTNQLTDVNNRTTLTAIDPDKDYTYGVNVNGVTVWHWYDDVTNVKVANTASLPRATINDPNDNDRISDRYIENGSYVRLKNITLGYTFPKRTIQKLHIENLRLYANIQNLLTITGYDGYDPEIGASTASANVMGLDNGRYPSPTVYSFGLNISF
jgi:TonB-linked SusC/RagA family outer membrane protein